MKIIQISPGELRTPVEKGGGIEGYILMLSKSMVKMGHTVTLLDRKYSLDDPDTEDFGGVRIVRLNARRFAGFRLNLRFALSQLWMARYANKYIKQADYDVVHVHTSVAGLCLSMINRKLRNSLFYTSHATRRTKDAVTSLGLMDRMTLLLENQMVKQVRKTVTLNEMVREKLITSVKIKPERVISLPVIIDTERFSPVIDTGDIKQRYGLDGQFFILFVGRIRADKGVEYLVRSSNIVINDHSRDNVRILLVGPMEEFGSESNTQSPYLQKINGLIQNYGLSESVRLTGPLPLDDLRKLYAACDIFVLPSLTEAMPTAVLEAMASGKAVIATKVGGIPRQIKPGENGILINPGDEKELAEAIEYLINNPEERERMGRMGREIAEDEFSSDKIAERLIRVYQDVE